MCTVYERQKVHVANSLVLVQFSPENKYTPHSCAFAQCSNLVIERKKQECIQMAVTDHVQSHWKGALHWA